MHHPLLLVALLAVSSTADQSTDSCGELSLTLEQCTDYQKAIAENDGIGGCKGKISAGIADNKFCQLQAQFVAYLLQKKVRVEGIPRMLEKRQQTLYGAQIKFDLAKAPSRGAEKAAVQIVEFFDFQCPYCYRLGNILDDVLKNYPDKVRLYHKMYPLSSHPNSDLAAAAALGAAGENKYWEMYSLLWTVPTPVTADGIAEQAGMLSFKSRQVKKYMQDKAIMSQVKADKAEGARAGVKATPTIFINGRENTLPDDNFIIGSLIDEILLSK